MSTALRRAITAEDIYSFQLISEPRFSPDDKSVAYVVTTIDEKSDGYHSSIYVVDLETGSSKRLTTANSTDSSIKWSQDGSKLAFISNRKAEHNEENPKNQIWLIRLDGGEAWRVSSFDDGVSQFDWSPDSSAFVAQSKSAMDSSDENSEEKDDNSDVVHITKLGYRANGTPGFVDQKPVNLWRVPVDASAPSLLEETSNFDDRSPAWSPAGQRVAFISNRTDDRDLNFNAVSELWSIPSAGGEARPILTGDTASFRSPVWSPDGSSIAVAGHWQANRGGSVDDDIWVANLDGSTYCVTEDFNRSAGDSAMSDVFKGSGASYLWTPDGKSIYFLASDSGSTQIYKIPSSGGSVSQITSGDRRISGMSINSDGSKLAYISATGTEPGNLYIADTNGSNERRLTNLNDEFLEGIALQQPEEFWVKSTDGTDVQGWILKPPGFKPEHTYPMILQIHGGPHGMYANAFMHEFQLMAARGYVVVYTNPRGSAGYGEDFTTATHLRWGETDMPDLMAAVDYVVDQGYVDEHRLGVTGGSYGGYMTLWVVGHTDRFKAAVTQRCVSNLYSFYGTSDIGWTFIDYEFGGKAWEHREHFMKYSPVSYVKDMTTPLLIVHSEEDYRCPIEQAEQVFISLKKLGRETELVRFPNENHDLSRSGKPKHRIQRLEYILGWFDRYM